MDQHQCELAVVETLRAAGARFAFVHGSRAGAPSLPADPDPRRDLDVAAWWGAQPEASWGVVDVPPGVDLLILDAAPLELAGRVALWGRLLFDDDPPARVSWQAQTRKIYLDEEPRQQRLHRVFVQARLGGP